MGKIDYDFTAAEFQAYILREKQAQMEAFQARTMQAIQANTDNQLGAIIPVADGSNYQPYIQYKTVSNTPEEYAEARNRRTSGYDQGREVYITPKKIYRAETGSYEYEYNLQNSVRMKQGRLFITSKEPTIRETLQQETDEWLEGVNIEF